MQFIVQLEERRDHLVQRSQAVLDAGREKGLDTLGTLRSGALDWQRTLAARREALAEETRPRLAAAQAKVIGSVERLLGHLLARLDMEAQRLGRALISTPSADEPEALDAAKASPPTPTAEASPSPKARKPAKKAKAPKAEAEAPEAKAPKAPRRGSRRLVLPIADYDTLTAKAVLAELPRLSAAQREIVLEHERAGKARKTVLRALEA